MIRQIMRWNINIIQGDLPKILVWLMRFYMGTVKQYIKPVYIKFPIHDYIKIADLLWLYKKACAGEDPGIK